MTIKFDVLKKAKINHGEFAALAGVSRITVSLWVNGHVGPHKLHEERIRVLVEAIASAARAGDLPLVNVPKEARPKKLRSVIAAYVKK